MGDEFVGALLWPWPPFDRAGEASAALPLQASYGIRSERQLMERLDYDLLFRWFVGQAGRGLGVDEELLAELCHMGIP